MCEALIERVQKAIDDATVHKSRLPEATMDVRGLTSPKIRHLLNNMCSVPETVYMEIGLWEGASLLAALSGNESTIRAAYAIDDWSQCRNGRHEARKHFHRNIRHCLADKSLNLSVIEENAFKLSLARIKHDVTVFYYDADHAKTREGVSRFFGCMSSPCVLLLDDWEGIHTVKEDWRAAEAEGEMKVVKEWELPTNNRRGDTELWWCGFYVAVLQRR